MKVAALAGTGLYLTGSRGLAASASAAVGTELRGAAAYRHWQAQARALLEPVSRLLQSGRASIDLAGPPSANGAAADRLESFARPMLLAAHYLQSEVAMDTPDAPAFRAKVAQWFREGLIAGTTVGGPEAWGPDANYHQLHVEMGLVAITLQIAPDQLWHPLTQAEKDQVASWLATARHSGYVDNNHYFMGVHVVEFLGRFGYGQPGDDAVVNEYFSRLEFMHRGHGWFQDGINQAFDYYNAYAFNFYGLWWARLHGAKNPARAQRWREWARQFTADYQHFFAANGEHPAFGRSITYRFNAIATFGLAVLEDSTDLPLGRLRRLCTRNLDFFLSRPIYQEQDCLAIGWVDRFDASRELYTGPGSPYWAAKGLSPLLLPSAHPFWHAAEEPLLSEIDDGAHVIAPAGLILRRIGGEVEIINAGSQVSHTNLRYGAWKWSKSAYRTGRAFTCAFPAQTNWSLDSALTIRTTDDRVYGRHSTVAVEMATTHTIYRWALGYAWPESGPPLQPNVAVDTGLWWNHDWTLQLHRYNAQQPVVFRLGGYALPLPDNQVEHEDSATGFGAWHRAEGGTVLQPITGFTARERDERLDDSTPRAHLNTSLHTTPVVVSGTVTGPGWLAVLAWTGHERAAAQAWAVAQTSAGAWELTHPMHGLWSIRHDFLPALDRHRATDTPKAGATP